MICLPVHIGKIAFYIQGHENKGHVFEIPTQNIPFKGLSEGIPIYERRILVANL